MGTRENKGYFAKHAKSSAMLVSLVLHGILALIALTFVAVTVIQKEEQKFEAKPVNRPKMQLKKLQVPVDVKKKKTQKPKLRKRIVVKPRLNQSMPDIKMPEISGVKGGLGNAAGAGLGAAGGVGFSMPEIDIFGIKGRGEKIFIVLDASAFMMEDKIGGIPAYAIIKSELVRILEGLNPTVLFNIAIYGGGDKMLFPQLVSANADNVKKVKRWLEPLNAVSRGMGDKDYGSKTVGSGGRNVPGPFSIEPLKGRVHDWAAPTMEAMRQQADVVFVLSSRWGHQAYVKKGKVEWKESQNVRYRKKIAEAKAELKAENAKRRASGQPPRVIPHGDRGLVHAYFPGEPLPPQPEWGWYSTREMYEAFSAMRAQNKDKTVLKSGLSNKDKDRFTINVVHFTPASNARTEDRFSGLASLTRGEYRQVEGLRAIQSYAAESAD